MVVSSCKEWGHYSLVLVGDVIVFLFWWVASLKKNVLIGGAIVFLFWWVTSLFFCSGGWRHCFLVLVGGVIVLLFWWVA